ncbi:MAG: hypothetical protein ACRDIX_05180 [Actinomycetota bacterium]
MGQRAGFDWARLTMGQKGILITGVLLLLDLSLLTWNRAGECPFCANLSGWYGIGTLAGLLVVALLIWEGLNIAGALEAVTAPRPLISAALAGGTALFALLRGLIKPGGFSYSIGAWIGIVLALAMAYAAYVRFQESQAAAPPPAAPPAA